MPHAAALTDIPRPAVIVPPVPAAAPFIPPQIAAPAAILTALAATALNAARAPIPTPVVVLTAAAALTGAHYKPSLIDPQASAITSGLFFSLAAITAVGSYALDNFFSDNTNFKTIYNCSSLVSASAALPTLSTIVALCVAPVTPWQQKCAVGASYLGLALSCFSVSVVGVVSALANFN